MREIEFRGKHTHDNEWKYGYLDYLNKDQSYVIHKGDGVRYFVDAETIGQYTGLKDKNGTKIFEGDIIRQREITVLNDKHYENDKDKQKHKQRLIKDCGAIFDDDNTYHQDTINVVECDDDRFYPFADDDSEWGTFNWNIPIEVIGNIYDNPELLDVDNERNELKQNYQS